MSDVASSEAEEIPEDGTPVAKLALRDAGIVLAALSLWAAADTWYEYTRLSFAGLLAVLDGVGVGIVVSRLAHEWGHFTGARWGGGVAPTAALTTVLPLFHFDITKNEAGAFRAMSVGGNVAHWLVVLLLLVAVPLDSPGRVALFCAAFGYAVYGSTTEFPIIRRAYAGASPVESFAGFSGEKLVRNRWIGAGAGVLLFLGL